MAETSYDKQWRWKKASLKKAERIKAQTEDNVGSFTPHFYTSNFQPSKDAPEARQKLDKYQPQPHFPSQDPGQALAKPSELHPAYNMTQTFKDMRLEDHGDGDLSSTSDSDEPIVELLERERRQWQAEREKLIQCIHLQQLELSQRNLAAQERAVDIAKDFAKVIESFEERLINIETHVQREITSLRSIAEALLVAFLGRD